MSKLRLLGGEPERMPFGVIITAYQVLDGSGRQYGGYNSKEEAEAAKSRAESEHPGQTFHVD